MNTIIVIVIVTIPAFIVLTVCAIVFHSYRKKHRVFRRQMSLSSSSQDDYMTDMPHSDYYRTPRHQRESLRVFEQPSPAYDASSLHSTNRHTRIHLSPIRTTPIGINLHQTSSTNIVPSVYLTRPPSYDELFLTPQTLTNR